MPSLLTLARILLKRLKITPENPNTSKTGTKRQIPPHFSLLSAQAMIHKQMLPTSEPQRS